MPKRDMQDGWSLLVDLARELSWTLRIAFFGGLLVGLGLGIYLVNQVPAEEVRRGFFRVLIVFVVGLMALGGFLGMALGAAVELAVQAIWGKKEDPRKRRRRDP
jgi:hypothetical protein